jgi:hypothetical protein
MFKKHHKQVPNKSPKLQCSQNIGHVNPMLMKQHMITSTKLFTLETNLLVLVNETSAKQSIEFGVFTKHFINPMFTKQRIDHKPLK